MTIDPAVLAVWEIVLGIVIACVAFIITFYVSLRMQRTHAFYRFGEAMSIGYAEMATTKILRGEVKPMPQTPEDLQGLTKTLEDKQMEELARRTKLLAEKKAELNEQTPPTQ